MPAGDGVGAAPFADGIQRYTGQLGSRFRAAEAVDQVGDGNLHELGVSEFLSAINTQRYRRKFFPAKEQK
jgi:hypothetical protein